MKRITSLVVTGVLATVLQSGCATPDAGRSTLWQRIAPSIPFAKKDGQGEASASNDALARGITRGRALERSKDWEQAHEVYVELLKTHPHSGELLHRLGVACDQLSRHQEAQEYYTRAIRAEPRNGELFNDLGYSFFLQGQLDKAESAIRKALVLDATSSRFHNNLGLVLGHQERYQESLEEFAKGGSQADAYYNLAFVYAAQGASDQAKECFAASLRIDPTHAKAQHALDSFQSFEMAGWDGDALAGEENVRYVPFIEKGIDGPDGDQVQQVTHSGDTTPQTRATDNAMRSLSRRSQSLIGRRAAETAASGQ